MGAPAAREHLVAEIERARVELLPGDIVLAPSAPTRSARLIVQPDATITAPNSLCLVEAKRIRSSSFQRSQLAREFVSVIRESGGRTPLLLLVLGQEPPVRVKDHAGVLTISEAIELALTETSEAVENLPDELTRADFDPARVDEVVAWTTWAQVAEAVGSACRTFDDADPSVLGTVRRLTDLVVHSVERHG